MYRFSAINSFADIDRDIYSRSTSEIDHLREHYGSSNRWYAKHWIEEFGPYRFTSTLNFVRRVSSQDAWHACDIYLRRMHKGTLGKQWKRRQVRPHSGVVVLEMAPLNPLLPNKAITPHFHFLWRDHPVLPRSDQSAIDLLDADLCKNGDRLKDEQGKRLCRFSSGLNRFLPVSGNGMPRYLTKQAYERNWEWTDRIRLISGEGAV